MTHAPLHALRPPSSGRRPLRTARGFTLVELVVVMLLMAVLAGVGLSRMADRDPFAVQAAADQLASALRLAQSGAMARRQAVHVCLTADPLALQLGLDAACTQPLAPPGGGGWLLEPQGLRASSGATFAFGPDGTPTLAAALDLRIRNADGSVQSALLRVEAGSGHVHRP